MRARFGSNPEGCQREAGGRSRGNDHRTDALMAGTPEGVPESRIPTARHKRRVGFWHPFRMQYLFPHVPGVSLASSLHPRTGWQPSRLAETEEPNSSGRAAARLPALAFGSRVEAAAEERLPRVAATFFMHLLA